MAESEYFVPDVHIGSVIVNWMKQNSFTQTHLSSLLEIPQPSLSRILRQKTMDTAKLYSISKELNHNFFFEYCRLHGNRVVSEQVTFPVINIGYVIHNKLHEMHISHKDLASMLGVDPSTISKLLNRPSIDTGKLVKISRAVSYNFFEEYCMPITSPAKTMLKESFERPEYFFSQDLVVIPTKISFEFLEKIRRFANRTGMTMEEVFSLAIDNIQLDKIEKELMKKKSSDT